LVLSRLLADRKTSAAATATPASRDKTLFVPLRAEEGFRPNVRVQHADLGDHAFGAWVVSVDTPDKKVRGAGVGAWVGATHAPLYRHHGVVVHRLVHGVVVHGWWLRVHVLRMWCMDVSAFYVDM
jgi:hypothetical protein